MTNIEIKDGDRKDGTNYVLDGHKLPLFFALVYLMDRRQIATPEEAQAYLDEMEKAL